MGEREKMKEKISAGGGNNDYVNYISAERCETGRSEFDITDFDITESDITNLI